jgi:hypothetical protein
LGVIPGEYVASLVLSTCKTEIARLKRQLVTMAASAICGGEAPGEVQGLGTSLLMGCCQQVHGCPPPRTA